jgi:hypothetical protein|tara:strand:+ start:340 stop:585 length:246 start_codon:yes stop_codon:yes gene_type:complete
MGKKIRDYRKEYDEYHGKPEEIARRASRNKARAEKEKSGNLSWLDEVDHMDNNPNNNSPENLRVVSRHENRTRSHTKRSKA